MRDHLPPPGADPWRPPVASPGRSGRQTRSVLAVVGIVLAVVLTLAGLAVLAFCVLVGVGMSNYASNK